MQAIVIDDSAGSPTLLLSEVPRPSPGPSELLVRIAAAGVNRADLRLSADHFGGNRHGIAGGELAGEVVEVGGATTGFAVGDHVMALAPASYAQFAVVDFRLAMAVPVGIHLVSAAALPAWYLTAHNALATVGALRAGETVLIQGVTSGVGIAALQLAQFLGAGKVIGVARSREKLARLAEAGLDRAVESGADEVEQVLAATGGRGAGLVIDLVGGGALSHNLASAAIGGRIIAVGRLGGSTDTLDINLLALRRLTLKGVTFRSRTLEERSAVARAFATEILPAVAEGRLRPIIDRTFPLDRATDAHQHVRENAHFGKTILEVGR